MKKKLLAFLLMLTVVASLGMAQGKWRLNPYTGKLEYYESTVGLATLASPSFTGNVGLSDGVLYGGKIVSEKDKQPITLPIWNEDMTRYAGNPIITKVNIGAGYDFVADPTLLVVNDILYIFFEAFVTAGNGEIWMAESTNGFSWSNFTKISVFTRHWSHPQALIFNNRVYLFYNTTLDEGHIYCRSSPVTGFPSWGSETKVFDAETEGWQHLVEFSILQHKGIWYLLGITGDGTPASCDEWIRGRWTTHFTLDWNTDSEELGEPPLLSVDDFAWVSYILEITALEVEDTLILFMGTQRTSDAKVGIGTFITTHLSPSAFEGFWAKGDHTFSLSVAGWDSEHIHRAHAAAYKGQWFFVYDAKVVSTGEWKIGIATMPLRGSSIVFSSGTGLINPARLWGSITTAPNGYIGVGVTKPVRRLNIVDNASQIAINRAVETGYASLLSYNLGNLYLCTGSNYDGDAWKRNNAAAAGQQTQLFIGVDGSLDFLKSASLAGETITWEAARFHITSAGRVGIGTATPGSKLSIVGLPTSSAGLSAGDIWNDNGTLKII